MAIAYADQHSLVNDGSLRLRVEAGCMHVAVAVSNPGVSGQPAASLALANEVIKRADFAVTQFCWVLVDKQNFVSPDDITDGQITNVITSFWPQIAAALTPV
jgi:hypothetical protein